jgi:hypothetical protein
LPFHPLKWSPRAVKIFQRKAGKHVSGQVVLNTRQIAARDISEPGLTIDKLMRRGIDLVIAEHKANRS